MVNKIPAFETLESVTRYSNSTLKKSLHCRDRSPTTVLTSRVSQYLP